MGPQSLHILCTYWYRLHIVARAGSYYGSAFQGFLGVTQGDPLSLAIFNVVVVSVVHHWISMVAGDVVGN